MFSVSGFGLGCEAGSTRLEWVRGAPLSSKLGTEMTVKARFWPLLEPFSERESLKPFELFSLCSEAVYVSIRFSCEQAHAASLAEDGRKRTDEKDAPEEDALYAEV